MGTILIEANLFTILIDEMCLELLHMYRSNGIKELNLVIVWIDRNINF
jgi:hypothetical protein